jgi:hypothetical protein
MLATAVPGDEFPRTGQLATLGPQEPGGQILLAQNQAPDFAYSPGPLGLLATGLGQFGTKDLTTSVNGYSFNRGLRRGRRLSLQPAAHRGVGVRLYAIEHHL